MYFPVPPWRIDALVREIHLWHRFSGTDFRLLPRRLLFLRQLVLLLERFEHFHYVLRILGGHDLRLRNPSALACHDRAGLSSPALVHDFEIDAAANDLFRLVPAGGSVRVTLEAELLQVGHQVGDAFECTRVVAGIVAPEVRLDEHLVAGGIAHVDVWAQLARGLVGAFGGLREDARRGERQRDDDDTNHRFEHSIQPSQRWRTILAHPHVGSYADRVCTAGATSRATARRRPPAHVRRA